MFDRLKRWYKRHKYSQEKISTKLIKHIERVVQSDKAFYEHLNQVRYNRICIDDEVWHWPFHNVFASYDAIDSARSDVPLSVSNPYGVIYPQSNIDKLSCFDKKRAARIYLHLACGHMLKTVMHLPNMHYALDGHYNDISTILTEMPLWGLIINVDRHGLVFNNHKIRALSFAAAHDNPKHGPMDYFKHSTTAWRGLSLLAYDSDFKPHPVVDIPINKTKTVYQSISIGVNRVKDMCLKQAGDIHFRTGEIEGIVKELLAFAQTMLGYLMYVHDHIVSIRDEKGHFVYSKGDRYGVRQTNLHNPYPELPKGYKFKDPLNFEPFKHPCYLYLENIMSKEHVPNADTFYENSDVGIPIQGGYILRTHFVEGTSKDDLHIAILQSSRDLFVLNHVIRCHRVEEMLCLPPLSYNHKLNRIGYATIGGKLRYMVGFLEKVSLKAWPRFYKKRFKRIYRRTYGVSRRAWLNAKAAELTLTKAEHTNAAESLDEIYIGIYRYFTPVVKGKKWSNRWKVKRTLPGRIHPEPHAILKRYERKRRDPNEIIDPKDDPNSPENRAKRNKKLRNQRRRWRVRGRIRTRIKFKPSIASYLTKMSIKRRLFARFAAKYLVKMNLRYPNLHDFQVKVAKHKDSMRMNRTRLELIKACDRDKVIQSLILRNKLVATVLDDALEVVAKHQYPELMGEINKEARQAGKDAAKQYVADEIARLVKWAAVEYNVGKQNFAESSGYCFTQDIIDLYYKPRDTLITRLPKTVATAIKRDGCKPSETTLAIAQENMTLDNLRELLPHIDWKISKVKDSATTKAKLTAIERLAQGLPAPTADAAPANDVEVTEADGASNTPANEVEVTEVERAANTSTNEVEVVEAVVSASDADIELKVNEADEAACPTNMEEKTTEALATAVENTVTEAAQEVVDTTEQPTACGTANEVEVAEAEVSASNADNELKVAEANEAACPTNMEEKTTEAQASAVDTTVTAAAQKDVDATEQPTASDTANGVEVIEADESANDADSEVEVVEADEAACPTNMEEKTTEAQASAVENTVTSAAQKDVDATEQPTACGTANGVEIMEAVVSESSADNELKVSEVNEAACPTNMEEKTTEAKVSAIETAVTSTAQKDVDATEQPAASDTTNEFEVIEAEVSESSADNELKVAEADEAACPTNMEEKTTEAQATEVALAEVAKTSNAEAGINSTAEEANPTETKDVASTRSKSTKATKAKAEPSSKTKAAKAAKAKAAKVAKAKASASTKSKSKAAQSPKPVAAPVAKEVDSANDAFARALAGASSKTQRAIARAQLMPSKRAKALSKASTSKVHSARLKHAFSTIETLDTNALTLSAREYILSHSAARDQAFNQGKP